MGEAGFVNPGVSDKGSDYVIVELRHDSQVGFSQEGFVGPSAKRRSVDSLNNALNEYRVREVNSHFGVKRREIQQRIQAAPSSLNQPVSAKYAQSGFVQIVPRRKKDAKPLAQRLNRSGNVWKAVVAPRPVPAGAADGDSTASRNFEPAQGYLGSAPDGLGAIQAWNQFDAKGQLVSICDIEGGWNLEHDDLPNNIRHLGGTLLDDPGWVNHGTAVVGQMVSRPNASGTVGISHRARMAVQSAFIDGVFNAAGAIANATSKLNNGDVILIELQAVGPNGKYVAMQYWDDVLSAIRAATARGITVVEAAGNGNEDFQRAMYRGTGLQKDSGAIVVGAGVPPNNTFGYFGSEYGFQRYDLLGTPRSRIFFSNYGDILNLQGWGWHVATTGYGDAQGGGENQWLTLRFAGTSSASPMIAGAVACLQGYAKSLVGQPLTPAEVRDILMRTGTPQQPGPGVPLTQRIGPLPNLPEALRLV